MEYSNALTSSVDTKGRSDGALVKERGYQRIAGDEKLLRTCGSADKKSELQILVFWPLMQPR
jgi:hypothetical protein